jgi:hypothetical protein
VKEDSSERGNEEEMLIGQDRSVQGSEPPAKPSRKRSGWMTRRALVHSQIGGERKKKRKKKKMAKRGKGGEKQRSRKCYIIPSGILMVFLAG